MDRKSASKNNKKTITMTTGKCQNCKEKDMELEEIETEKGKENWCDACIEGYNLEKNENNRS